MSRLRFLHDRRALTHTLLLVALLSGLLIAPALPAGAVPAAQIAGPAGPQIMPPHPGLKDKIRKGEVKEPVLQDQIAPNMAGPLGLAEQQPLAAGQLKALAVLVEFSDQVHVVQATFFDNLLFAAPVTGRGSVRDYFNDVSFGQVDVVALTLPSQLGWRLAPGTKASYVGNANCTSGGYPNDCRKLAEDIVDAIDGVVDFSQYDNNHDGIMEPIMLIHSGPGAEYTGAATDIWSHSWYLYNYRHYDNVTINRYVIMPEYWGTASSRYDMTIGVFAHEMGHGFWNLPDLYDTDGGSEGIGNWSLMAGGSWNGTAGRGDSPAWPDAWSRIKMGYATPTTVAANTPGQSIPKATTSNTGTIFKLKSSVLNTQEYFLVENRQKTAGSYDEYLPGSGLAIWHIDEAKSGNTQQCTLDPHSLCGATHYEVALEQADGLRNLEFGQGRGDAGDLFPGSTNNTNWSGSTHPGSSSWYTSTPTNIGVTKIGPSADTMTADLAVAGGPALPSISITDASVTEGNSGSIAAVFTVRLSAAATSPVSVNWATANGTATGGVDYVAVSGVANFAAGQTSQTVTVQVTGDTTVEPNETFFVNLSSPSSNATISDSQGQGTIVNDDVAAGPVLHVGDLDGKQAKQSSKQWSATVTITVHDANHSGVAGATVMGNWGSGSGNVSCTTGTGGTCSITKKGIGTATPSVTFTVTGVTKTGATYNASANHDPEVDSTGTKITINKP